jgi:hypothetical protein
MKPRTRQRPAAGEPGAVRDRTSRTINLDSNCTPRGKSAEFVADDEATGRVVGSGSDLWMLFVRFGADVAAAVADGLVECRHDPVTASWFFRYPDMRHVTVHDVTDEMRERLARLFTRPDFLDGPCPVACSPAACACPNREAS